MNSAFNLPRGLQRRSVIVAAALLVTGLQTPAAQAAANPGTTS